MGEEDDDHPDQLLNVSQSVVRDRVDQHPDPERKREQSERGQKQHQKKFQDAQTNESKVHN